MLEYFSLPPPTILIRSHSLEGIKKIQEKTIEKIREVGRSKGAITRNIKTVKNNIKLAKSTKILENGRHNWPLMKNKQIKKLLN